MRLLIDKLCNNNYKTISGLKLAGYVLIVMGIIINQWTWLYFFDADGKLAGSKKIIFFYYNIWFLGFGLLFLFARGKTVRSIKRLTKITIYITYLFVCLEIFSFITIKFILPDKLNDQINFALGKLERSSGHVSWRSADLWSNYKPNPFSIKVNDYGFRYGGGHKNQGSTRILCIGGSTTWGDGVHDAKDTYPAQLEHYLIGKGFNVDVINAGVPYHTSLEVLMRYLTVCRYTNPDIVLIHTGGNDNGPLCSPYPYKADYSHWRTVGYANNDNLFMKCWNKYPFSFFRLFFIYIFKPGTGTSTGIQHSSVKQEMLANTDLSKIKPLGLMNYFQSLIAVSKSAGAQPVTILFNSDQNRTNSLAHKYFDNNDDFLKATFRAKHGLTINNAVIDSISTAMNVPVIPFQKWEPLDSKMWIDHCHLNPEGARQKAVYIAEFLIEKYILMQ